MGSENYKIVKNFINDDEVKLILDWVDSLNPEDGDPVFLPMPKLLAKRSRS